MLPKDLSTSIALPALLTHMSQTLFAGPLILPQCLPQCQGLLTLATWVAGAHVDVHMVPHPVTSSGRPGGTQVTSSPWTLLVECMGQTPWQLFWMKMTELYHPSLPLSVNAAS